MNGELGRRGFLAALGASFVLFGLPMRAWAGGAEAAIARGEFEEAIGAYTSALAAEKDPLKRVDLLLRLAAAERLRGELTAADGYLRQAEATGLLAPRVANDRGLWHLAAGDAPKADSVLAAAFAAARSAGDPALAATAANNLGLARMALGRADEAGRAFEAARGLFLTLGDDLGRADALTNAGLAHRRAGRLRDARVALEEALALFSAGGSASGEVDASNDLGIVLQSLGLDDAAAALYTSARARTTDVRRLAALSANLATVHHRKGEIEAARTLYLQAEAGLLSIGRDDDAVTVALQRVLLGAPDLAELRGLYALARSPGVKAAAGLNLAGLLLGTADAEAMTLAAEARRLAPALAWRADYLEGRAALAAGNRTAALPALERAVEALERIRRTLTEEEAAGFRGANDAVYETLVEARLGAGDTRGAALAAEQMALADHDAPPVPSDAAGLELRALSDRQTWLERELAGAPPSRAAALRAQLGEVQATFAAKVDEMRASSPHFAELVRTDPEDLEAVRAELPPGVVVLQPVLLPQKLVLLVYRRERLVVQEVAVPASEVSITVSRLGRSLRAASLFDPAWTIAQCDQLGTWLIAPLAEELKNCTTLVVSSTGIFRQLPFSLLRANGAWLASWLPIAHITHVGSLRSTAARFKVEAKTLLLVGNPDGTLPGAESEVIAIGQRYKGAKVMVGAEGERLAVLEASTGRTLVHLATHGLLDANFPERSHIVLARYPEPDGRLGYREIPGLGPWLDRTRLVVLSACESALPADVVGMPGKPPMAVSGLAGQFRRAGVETLVASLWQVSDDGTLALMTAFYERLAKGDDIARALQAAQVSMLADARFVDPYFWAPFIIVGDWR